jgi:hypothetical protein
MAVLMTTSTYAATFQMTAPNGGESWPLDTTRLITWSPGNVSGNVRLDLYKGGTALANKVGTITTNTPAATGKYSWHVGKYIGGTAIAGEGYLVVISSYTPEMKDSSNGPFTITSGTLQTSHAKATKGLPLTNLGPQAAARRPWKNSPSTGRQPTTPFFRGGDPSHHLEHAHAARRVRPHHSAGSRRNDRPDDRSLRREQGRL